MKKLMIIPAVVLGLSSVSSFAGNHGNHKAKSTYNNAKAETKGALKDFDKEIEELEEKTAEVSSDMKDDFQKRLSSLKDQRKKLERMSSNAMGEMNESYKDAKMTLEKEISELKAEVRKETY
jgi:peptidoglycan hydrolase CwlO-like protein